MSVIKPKISVLMPVYNTKEKWLRESIESILEQTYKDFEFIIINDGSTNNAKDVILSYKDKRIRYYEQENKGLVLTLNYGLTLCNGEYIARMDSDDISLNERFEKQVEILDSNPQIGVVGSFLQTIPDNKKISYYKEYPKYIDMLNVNQLAHPVVMIRKSVLEKFNLKYENYIHAEDYELWSRLIKYTDIYNIQEVLLKYRIHSESVSIKFKWQQITNDKKIKQNMLDFLTGDAALQNKIKSCLFGHSLAQKCYIFLLKNFSLKNLIKRINKIMSILGINIKIKTERF